MYFTLADKGSHDWLIDQLMYNEGGKSGFQAPNSLEKGEETTHEKDEKCQSDMADMKDKEVAHETKSMPDHTSEPSLIPNTSNVETSRISEKPRPRYTKPHGRLINFPMPATTTIATTINEFDNLPSPIDKRHENIFFADRRNCHTPTYSIASDLQVEVSEVGSLASTVDENGETNSNTDRDSVLYDGDIDRDVSSGSEDLWGASFHGGQAHGVSEEDIAEASNNSKDMASSTALRQINEENVADVSSMYSKSDMPEDTSTHAINSDHNIFGYMKYSVGESEAPQSSNSSSVSSPPKQLIDSCVDQLPNETHSEISEVRIILVLLCNNIVI